VFRCDFCKKVSAPSTPLKLIAVKERETSYTNLHIDPETEEESLVTSHGSEIVEEKKACLECVKKGGL
jgi:hypothetical protein